MFASLLEHKYKEPHNKFWKSCGAFLYQLSIFRNAIVHWHPLTIVHLGRGTSNAKEPQAAVRNPMPGRYGSLTIERLKPFILDCLYIRAELDQFAEFLRDPAGADDPTLPERFSRPLPRQNLASLQPIQRPKGSPKPPRS